MNNRSSIFAGLGLLLALFATILTFAGQSDQGRKAFDGQQNNSQNTNTANKKKKGNQNSNTMMNSNMPNSNTAPNINTEPNTNGTPG